MEKLKYFRLGFIIELLIGAITGSSFFSQDEEISLVEKLETSFIAWNFKKALFTGFKLWRREKTSDNQAFPLETDVLTFEDVETKHEGMYLIDFFKILQLAYDPSRLEHCDADFKEKYIAEIAHVIQWLNFHKILRTSETASAASIFDIGLFAAFDIGYRLLGDNEEKTISITFVDDNDRLFISTPLGVLIDGID